MREKYIHHGLFISIKATNADFDKYATKKIYCLVSSFVWVNAKICAETEKFVFEVLSHFTTNTADMITIHFSYIWCILYSTCLIFRLCTYIIVPIRNQIDGLLIKIKACEKYLYPTAKIRTHIKCQRNTYSNRHHKILMLKIHMKEA